MNISTGLETEGNSSENPTKRQLTMCSKRGGDLVIFDYEDH